MSINIIKADGTKEPFKVAKLKQSLQRAGATKVEIAEVVRQIEDSLYEGMKTGFIYRKAFSMLHNMSSGGAARYSLRRALFGLGPTGFPFEDFLSRLFEYEGYKTKSRLVIRGKCARHEIDVAAYTSEYSFIAEAKFHARPGIKSDLQVALYSQARKQDLLSRPSCQGDQCGIQDFWIVTNTKFTSAAIEYASCVGLRLLSWDYPREDNLHDRIQKSKLYPITVLQNLTGSQKKLLLSKNIIICKDLLKKQQVLKQLHLTDKKRNAVLSEARQLGEEA